MNPHGKREAERIEPRVTYTFDGKKMTVREACRERLTIDGSDSQALEHALSTTEAERDDLLTKNVELHAEIVSLRAGLAGAQAERNRLRNEAGEAPLNTDMVIQIRRITDAAGLDAVAFLDDAVSLIVAQRDAAVSSVNKLVAEVARVTRDVADAEAYDAEVESKRVRELETCLRDAPPSYGLAATHPSRVVDREHLEWLARRDALLAGPPAKREEAKCLEPSCASNQGNYPCDCGATCEDKGDGCRYVDPAPPAEAERPSDAEQDCSVCGGLEYLPNEGRPCPYCADVGAGVEHPGCSLSTNPGQTPCNAHFPQPTPTKPSPEGRPSDAEINRAKVALQGSTWWREGRLMRQLHAHTKRLEASNECVGCRLTRSLHQERAEAAEKLARHLKSEVAAHRQAHRETAAELESARAEEGERRTYWCLEMFDHDRRTWNESLDYSRQDSEHEAQLDAQDQRETWLRNNTPGGMVRVVRVTEIHTPLAPSEGGK